MEFIFNSSAHKHISKYHETKWNKVFNDAQNGVKKVCSFCWINQVDRSILDTKWKIRTHIEKFHFDDLCHVP